MSAPHARISLSPPHVGEAEERMVLDALRSGWVAPLGPHVVGFEAEMAAYTGAAHALALSSGTAALHLALLLAGVGAGDRVYVSSLTFVASVNPIRYVGATPVLLDSERDSWNLDPALLAATLERDAQRGTLPRALILVHLYGQAADIDPIVSLCEDYGVLVIEDAAEALGATYRGASPGIRGHYGVFSFNGNKVITTSGGGMLVTRDAAALDRARYLATQARDDTAHYEHREVGYNYRLSNLCAAVGRAQLAELDARVDRRRTLFARYRDALADLPGLHFQPEAPWGRHTRWLTCLTLDPAQAPIDREALRLHLETCDIESRPVWKPMHLQPLYASCEMHGGAVAEELFRQGLCLPSGSGLRDEQQERVIAGVREAFGG